MEIEKGPTPGIRLGSKVVGPGHPLFFIAEAGVNHNGDLDRAKRMVHSAKEAGADAVKFQTYRVDRLNTRWAPKASYHIETTGPDSAQSFSELLRTLELSRGMHVELIEECRKTGILFLSTPYDEESADMLEELGVVAFKIASTDLNNIPFLRHVARKRRPILLSTAMSTLEEVQASVEAIREEGQRELIVMHATGNYPAQLKDSHLRAMVTLRETLGLPVGYSDHTLEDVNPLLAVALGAVVYEKHFTLDRNLPGPDHRMSLTVQEMKRTVSLIRNAEQAMGSAEKGVLHSETHNRERLRKSLVAARKLNRNQILQREHIAIRRPGTGLPPSAAESLVGRRLAVDVHEGDLLAPSMFERT